MGMGMGGGVPQWRVRGCLPARRQDCQSTRRGCAGTARPIPRARRCWGRAGRVCGEGWVPDSCAGAGSSSPRRWRRSGARSSERASSRTSTAQRSPRPHRVRCTQAPAAPPQPTHSNPTSRLTGGGGGDDDGGGGGGRGRCEGAWTRRRRLGRRGRRRTASCTRWRWRHRRRRRRSGSPTGRRCGSRGGRRRRRCSAACR
jgi:hypothetical protein